jgi:PUA-domain protein
MKRKQLSNKEIKDLNSQVNLEFFSKKDRVEIFNDSVIFRNDEPVFFYFDGRIVPTLRLLLKENFLNTVVIDMPAVKFIANGADVMRPGIVAVEEFENDEIVSVVDEQNKKPIAVAVALFDSKTLWEMSEGKVLKNVHFVGDKTWKFMPTP